MEHYKTVNDEQINLFSAHLCKEERCPGTIEKYLRDMRAFAAWLGQRPVSKQSVSEWKEHLIAQGYCATTINSMLAAVFAFFKFVGLDECRTRFLRVQRQIFRGQDKDLSRDEYNRLLSTAQKLGRYRLCLLMETICATGIRVSEVQYITVEAARAGKAVISLKGKIRTIFLPSKLCRKLIKFAKKQKTASGEIFLTKNGKRLSRKQIWYEMKGICERSGVSQSKVYPHNLRHLFARVFYQSSRDVAKLADVLGHSSIETTRIYLIATGSEHIRHLDRLGLVS